MAKVLPAVDKLDSKYLEHASTADEDTQRQEVVVREFDPKFMRKTMLKVRSRRSCSRNCTLTLVVGLDPDASIDIESVPRMAHKSKILLLTILQSTLPRRWTNPTWEMQSHSA